MLQKKGNKKDLDVKDRVNDVVVEELVAENTMSGLN